MGHYYKNDFARHCQNMYGGGHKMQTPRKMPEDFWRQTFLFMEVITINRLANYIYGGRQDCLSRKIDLWRR